MKMDICRYRRRSETTAAAARSGQSLSSRVIRRPLQSLADILRAKIHPWLTPPACNAAIISCSDPEEAYLQACIACAPFCYVSPALYGLGPTGDEPKDACPESQPSDEE